MELAPEITRWAKDLGFQQAGIAATDLSHHEGYLNAWLAKGHDGEMSYMSRHGTRRSRPAELIPGTRSVITVRMNYLPERDADKITTR
jgi:epoxyqueuosine reductase